MFFDTVRSNDDRTGIVIKCRRIAFLDVFDVIHGLIAHGVEILSDRAVKRTAADIVEDLLGIINTDDDQLVRKAFTLNIVCDTRAQP